MSYHTWTTYGYGVCVDDIETTAQKLLELAAMKPSLLKEVRDYLDEEFPDGYEDDELEIEDFNDLEDNYCNNGIAYFLYNVIDDNELVVASADDYNGVTYILYQPSYQGSPHYPGSPSITL